MARPKRQPLVAIVDDDAGMRQATQSLLDSAGFTTSSYSNAEAFLRSRRARTAACLVLDMRLPGMSGLELYRRVRKEGFDAPAILVTADHDRGGRLQAAALAAGILAVLYKPFDGDALVSLVHRALEKQSS